VSRREELRLRDILGAIVNTSLGPLEIAIQRLLSGT
jgi:hypothetical protein